MGAQRFGGGGCSEGGRISSCSPAGAPLRYRFRCASSFSRDLSAGPGTPPGPMDIPVHPLTRYDYVIHTDTRPQETQT